MNQTQSIMNSSANTATATGAISGTATAVSSFGGWITENAVLIGVTCTVASIVIAVIFHVISSAMTYTFSKRKLELEKSAQISKWIDEGKTSEEIEEILRLGEKYAS